jgi:general stress protein 26
MGGTINEVIEKARSMAAKSHFCHLATNDGNHPQVRAMSFVLTEDGEIWFSTSAKSRKINQLRKNPNAEAYFTDDKGFHCKIDGVCVVSTDSTDKKKQWKAQPELRDHFKSIDDPDFAIIKLKPKRYEVMSVGNFGYQVADA